ncbi:FAR1-related sequence 5-like protein [Tanacetum coccineum]
MTTSLTSHLLSSTSTARACNINEADLFVVPVVGEENLLIEAGIEELDDVTMNEDVEANIPRGTTYWEPNVNEQYLPLEGKRYDTIEECVEFYSVYAEKGGFKVKKLAQKKTKSGMVKSMYVMYNREGVLKEININTLDPQNSDKQIRNTRYRITGCMARIKVDLDHVSGKYDMVFVPFTGIDNHLKCVNFGSGMLLREDTEAYTWLLTSFMTAHEKQPTMVVTDQDGAMKRAIEAVLTESTHRLCMWHIMQKVLAKVVCNPEDGSVECVGEIPPALRRNTNRYGEKDKAIEKLTNEANFVVDKCLFLLRKDEEHLKQFVEKLENIKKEIQASNKGGRRGERRKSGREIAMKAKAKRAQKYGYCGEKTNKHTKTTCPLNPKYIAKLARTEAAAEQERRNAASATEQEERNSDTTHIADKEQSNTAS